jgi:hypothetical protein
MVQFCSAIRQKTLYMKHVILFVLLLVGFSAIVLADAPPVKSPGFAAQLTQESSNAFVLRIDNPEKKKLNIWIRHSWSGTVADTTIRDYSYGCRYSLDKAEDGKYTITISSGKERIVKEIEINTVTTVNREVKVL